ncbi:citrate synthase [Prosthecomicrobium hirschii]|uniref:citrate synthase n=1 Tax=Prosthecodimorpha hirschii TaxID=665126 RepID=UPI003B8A69F6
MTRPTALPSPTAAPSAAGTPSPAVAAAAAADMRDSLPRTPVGLDGVVAAETVLSHVDGAAGRLIVRGHDLETLAGMPFEAVLALLWTDLLPGSPDAAAIRTALGRARLRAFDLMLPRLAATEGLSPVEGLRLLLGALGDGEAEPHAVLAVATVPVFVAGLTRRRAGQAPVAPDPARGLADDFLAMLRGAPAGAEAIAALETYLVTVADHGLNASTFAARVIASTEAGLFSAVIGALSALKGPLHGGAPGPVLDMLDAIGSEAAIGPWIDGALRRGERLMGFGHRIYRVRDPRADVLKGAVSRLRGAGNRIGFAESVEREALARLAAAKPLRPLDTNVEFYTALLLEALDLPRDLFTCIFAMGRMAGWTAHVLEQERSGRLIRPQSRYVGPMPATAVQGAA